MKNHIGGEVYEGNYVIESNGELFGPFESRSDALDFALERELELPWTIRLLNVPLSSTGP